MQWVIAYLVKEKFGDFSTIEPMGLGKCKVVWPDGFNRILKLDLIEEEGD